MTESEAQKRKPGRPKKVDAVPVVDHTVADLDESKPGRTAHRPEHDAPPSPYAAQPTNDEPITGRRVRPRSGQNIVDPVLHEGSKPTKLQEALGRVPVVFYMGGGAIQITPTDSTIITLNTGQFAKKTQHGFWLRRANPTQPFSEAFDPVDDAAKIALVDAFIDENPVLCRKVGVELSRWDGGKLAPPVDRWDSLTVDAIGRVILAGAVDPMKALRYENQRTPIRQDRIDAIELANASLEAEAEAALVQAEIGEAREREAHVDAVAV